MEPQTTIEITDLRKSHGTTPSLPVFVHRRTLPKGARLLTTPTCMSRELVINPHFRNLRKQGHFLMSAIKIWYKHLSRRKFTNDDVLNDIDESRESKKTYQKNGKSKISQKTESSLHTWNLNHADIARPVFITVYTNDLQNIISDLKSNSVTPLAAAKRLSDLSNKMRIPQSTRRPIPNSLPTEKSMWLGSLALALLGSPPAAMTRSDAQKMKLPAPLQNSDRITISKERLLTVLFRLGVIDGLQCKEAQLVIALWKEASWDDAQRLEHLEEIENGCTSGKMQNNYDAVFNEKLEYIPDEIELGYLKMELYGIHSTNSRFCSPCGESSKPKVRNTHTVVTGNEHVDREALRTKNLKKLKRVNGELLRHEIEWCAICKNNVGCPIIPETAGVEHGDMIDDEGSISDVESLVYEVTSVASSNITNFDDHLSIEDTEFEVAYHGRPQMIRPSY